MGMKRWGVALILVLAFFGLADSAYLAQSAASGTPLICDTRLSGCNVVASSEYSQIFGIPVAEFGVLFYGILLVLAALELVIFDQLLRRVLQLFALVGVAVSLYSTIVQVYYIQALCIYCLASGVATVFIFILASLIEPLYVRRSKSLPPPTPTPPHLSMPPTA
jgi:uncharacterized membrane protein